MTPEDALNNLQQLSKKHALKAIRKYFDTLTDPWCIEAQIVQLQARQTQLNPEFHGTTP